TDDMANASATPKAVTKRTDRVWNRMLPPTLLISALIANLLVGVLGRRRVPSGCGHPAAPAPPPLGRAGGGAQRVPGPLQTSPIKTLVNCAEISRARILG